VEEGRGNSSWWQCRIGGEKELESSGAVRMWLLDQATSLVLHLFLSYVFILCKDQWSYLAATCNKLTHIPHMTMVLISVLLRLIYMMDVLMGGGTGDMIAGENGTLATN
jgi:hypothetical protein